MTLTDEQIRIELRELREKPSEGFAAQLDAWAEEGFPEDHPLSRAKSRRPAGIRLRRPVSWASRPALAGAAVLLLAVAVTAGVLRSQDGGPGGSTQELSQPAAGAGAAQEKAVSPSGQAGAAGGAAPSGDIEPLPEPGPTVPPTTPVPPGTERPRNGQAQIQERSASLTLSTEPDQVQDVADGVVQVTDRYEGFIDTSSVQSGGHRPHASFALRIPAVHLRDALADLSDLAHVASRNEGSVNITAPYVSAGERFADAQAQVNALLRELQSATSASEIASLRDQLRAARAELASARSELRSIKQRAGLSQLDLAITAGDSNGSWSIGDAADDAVGVLEAIGGAVLVALAVLVPLAGIAALGWLATRDLRRRRREAPLDR